MVIPYALIVKYGLIPLSLGVMLVVKHYWPSYQDDNKIEEMIETVIESQTGMDVDITPATPEKKNGTTK